VDVAEIQAAITDELKKVKKEEFSAAFQTLYDRAKACIHANGAYFEFKNKRHVSSIFKKISPKTLGPHCVLQSVRRGALICNNAANMFRCIGTQNTVMNVCRLVLIQ